MKKFIFNCIIFLLPFLITIIIVIYCDPFKVFLPHEEYYANNFVNLNRGVVCLKLFQKNNKKYNYDSFIFGSSRSQAFKIENWLKYLPKNSDGFHFDASGEGLYGIYNKLKYLDKTGNDIKNSLIILDLETMTCLKNRKGHLYISPPELSEESIYVYWREILSGSLNPQLLIGYFDYKINKVYRSYMGSLFNNAKYDQISNNQTGDLYYGYDKMIAINEKAYYETLIKKGVFYDRKKQVMVKRPIQPKERELLIKIHSLLIKHKTNYYIVISPLYDQFPCDTERVVLLKTIFDPNRVYDFSGRNELTNSIYNYYESSHYRPHIADYIMKKIYQPVLTSRVVYLSFCKIGF